MVIFCFACKNNSKANHALGYFRFPKDENRCVLWFQALNKPKFPKHTAEFCYTNLRLCSEHFETKDISVNAKRKRLDFDAVPVLKLDLDQSISVPIVSSISCEADSHILEQTSPHPVSLNTLDLAKSDASDQNAVLSVPLNTSTLCWEDSEIVDIDQPSTSRMSQSFQSDVSTETPQFLSASTPRKIGLKRKVRSLAERLRRKQVCASRSSSSPRIAPSDIKDFFDKNYTPHMANFIKMQMELLNKTPKGARYSMEYKQFAITLYFLGPKCYKYLATTFRLPSKSTLMNVTRKWPINPGLNEFIFLALKNQIENMSVSDRDCILCVDEMSLHTNFHYNIGCDEIIGFHETIKNKNYKAGNNALALMVRGISSNWKQPIAYFFVNSSCPVEDLKCIILESIRKLHSINLKVHILVSDQGSNFFKLSKILGVTLEKPFFLVDDLKVYYMFDVPHLLKSTRNNFFKYHFHINGYKTSKEYLNIFYNKDKNQAYRLAPKLSDAHIFPTNFQKMKVKYASQVFSATVAVALNTCISLRDVKPEAYTLYNL